MGPHRVPQRPPPLLRQGGRRLEMASAATTRRAACPRRVKTGLNLLLWTQHDLKHVSADMARNSWPWCGPDPRGPESAAGRRPRVSCGRRRHLPRTAGWTPANGGLGEPWTVGLGEPRTAAWSPANGGLEGSRPADSRWSRRTPTPTCSGLWRDYERRLPCRGTDTQEQNKWLLKNGKQNEVKGRRLLFGSGLLSQCTQQGETRNTQTRIKLK